MSKLLISLLLTAGVAQAATTNLTTSVTIATTCVFGTANAGTFGYDPAQPNLLNTSSNGGNPASVVISYNGTPTVTVAEPTSFSSTPAGYSGSPQFSSAVTSNNGGSLSYTSGLASYTQTGGSSDTITLQTGVNNGSSAFPLGNYTSTSVVTCN